MGMQNAQKDRKGSWIAMGDAANVSRLMSFSLDESGARGSEESSAGREGFASSFVRFDMANVTVSFSSITLASLSPLLLVTPELQLSPEFELKPCL